jgi:RNA polymerase sigma-B factor
VRVPRDVQELNVKLGRVVDDLTGKFGRSPSVDELAQATQSSTEQVVEALDSSRAYNTVSLSAPGPDDGEDDTGDPLEQLGDEDHGYELAEERQLLREGFKDLDERERKILHMRFFLGFTQSDIAERIGISQMHVSRLIRQSIDEVRDRLDSGEADPAPASEQGDCRSGSRARASRAARRRVPAPSERERQRAPLGSRAG